MISISIIVCTHNPNPILLKRVLNSIVRQEKSVIGKWECIVVDNNSFNNDEIKQILEDVCYECLNNFKLIKENKPGLTHARIAGYQNSINDVILFVDDDNELDDYYLSAINELFDLYKDVYCWGPGVVSVEFLTLQNKQKYEMFKPFFQQKNKLYVEYGCVRNWCGFSPAGTGLVVKREVMELYSNLLNEKKLNAIDRTGKQLTSGGDSQIVHCATLLNKASGQAPSLKLTHLIEEKKCKMEYLKELLFQVNSSINVHVQIFPELKKNMVKIPSKIEFINYIWLQLKAHKFKVYNDLLKLNIVAYLGLINGSYLILNQKVPIQFRFFMKLFKLKL